MLLAGGAVSCAPATPPATRAPNFVVVVADDLGFSDTEPYGGEIPTPNLAALAAQGVRFTQFYVTGRCWPTRAALLTGYYPQQIGADPPSGRLPRWAASLPQRLRALGYRSYHAGKWHVMGVPRPVADAGFDRSYWLEDWDRYFGPTEHYEDDVPLPPVARERGWYATTAIADRAIAHLREHREQHPERPFFLYVAFTAPHFPLQAPAEDIRRHRDRYVSGWDAIRRERTERVRALGIAACKASPADPVFAPRYFEQGVLDTLGPGEVALAVPWDSLTPEQQRFQAVKMAIHAAMVDRMDRELGRVLEQLRAMGAYDDTAVFFLSDNGADATLLVRGDGHDADAEPGSARTFLSLGPGWAGASNAPFRGHKIWMHEGGIATPLFVHWPRGLAARGELRHDVGHAIDFVPTILELAGGAARNADIDSDARAPRLPGRSLVATLRGDTGAARAPLYFSHQGNRALRDGDSKLVSARERGDVWELYDLLADRCEGRDLATAEPDRVRALAARWREIDGELARWRDSPRASPRRERRIARARP